jgi:hypothetical protein
MKMRSAEFDFELFKNGATEAHQDSDNLMLHVYIHCNIRANPLDHMEASP